MKRLELIDGLRGYFLVFMLINHLVFDGGYWLVKINHRWIAFVEDAQGFVFLSGLLIGMVYGKRMDRNGFAPAAKAVWSRARELYAYSLGLIAIVMTVMVVYPQAIEAWQPWTGDLAWTFPSRVVAAALLVFQPTYMDILPQYICYMLVAPFIIKACLDGRWQLVLVASGLLWLTAQFGAHRLATAPLNTWLAGDTGAGLRAYFNLFGWQLVFVPAMVFGVLTATGRLDWNRVFRPDDTLVPLAALGLCLFFLPLRIGLSYGLIPGQIYESFQAYENRADFGLVYLLNFLGAAGGLAWLLIAGPRHASAGVRWVADKLGWFFQLPFLRLIGRHSLYVYVWHVLIVYMMRLVDVAYAPFGEATKIAIAVGCIALLALPALWRERGTLFAAPQSQPGK